MPVKKAPAAKTKKVWLHAFYLAQPIVQFLTLIAVLVVFTRCSPLASSTDRLPKLKTLEEVQGPNSAAAAEAAREESIVKNSKEVSEHDLTVVSETEFRQSSKSLLHADDNLDERQVQSLEQERDQARAVPFRRTPKILVLPLGQEKLTELFREGKLRVNLSERLHRAQPRARQSLYKLLAKSLESGDLDANSHLVLSDAAMRRARTDFTALSVRLKLSFSQVDADEAYLEIRRVDEPTDSQDNAALLEAALRETRRLAIILE